MTLKFARPGTDPTIERLPAETDSLRDALEEALRRIDRLEEEVARLRGELPPREGDG